MESSHSNVLKNELPINTSTQNKAKEQVKETYNLLISAAMPLLTFMVNIRNTIDLPEVDELHAKMIEQIQTFEQQAKLLGYSHRYILAARYCLCTALDEAVFNTSWGQNSIWAQQSLLATFHNETWGGERFYVIIEKMIGEAGSALDLLELLYFILNLGFEGKYYNEKAKWEEVLDSLFHAIAIYKVETRVPLSPRGESNDTNPATIDSSIPVWILIVTVLCSLFTLGMIFQYYSNEITQPVINHANKIGFLNYIMQLK